MARIELNSIELQVARQPSIHINDNATANSREEEMIVNNLKRLPRFKKIEIVIEIIGLIMLILIWTYFNQIVQLINKKFITLPQNVPTEFDYNGQVVRYADKSFLLILPSVNTIVYIIINVLQLVTHRFNYDCIGLNVYNAQAVYRSTRMVLAYLKILTEALFAFITFTMLRVVQQQASSQSMYFAFVFIIPYILGGLTYYNYLKKIDDQSSKVPHMLN